MTLEETIYIPTLGRTRKVDLRAVVRRINESPLPITIVERVPTEEESTTGAESIESAEDARIMDLLEQVAHVV